MPPITRGRANASPFSTLWDVQRQMDRVLNGLNFYGSETEAPWGPPTEIREDAEALYVEVEVPGVRSEDIELTVENNVLTVSGEKRIEREEGKDDGDYRLFERRYGRFSRSFTLPPTVDPQRVDANYDNGVLAVRLPKSEESKPRRIQVKAGTGSRSIESNKKER